MIFTKKIFLIKKFFREKQFFQNNISIYKNCSDVIYNEHWMIFIERMSGRTHERTHERTNERTSLIFRYAHLSIEGIIEHHFMTFPTFHSIEINAHMLTFIAILVLNKKLPVESLRIYLFSSQPCENIFRSARALKGPFSNMTNFTVQQFLSKTRKILILNEIKCYEESNFHSNAIKFPTHHKQHRNKPLPSTFTDLNELSLYGIE